MITATAISDTDNLLDLQSVTKSLPVRDQRVPAVKDINLQYQAG